MSITTNNISVENLDEFDRQKKQAEMIRQYLQVTSIDTNSLPIKHSTLESDSSSTSLTTTLLPLSSINFNELRKDLKLAEERVERLRQELKEIQKKRDESYLITSPPQYVLPSINKTNTDFLNHNLSTSTNRGIIDKTPPLLQEFLSLHHHQQQQQQQQNPRQQINSAIPSSFLLSNFNSTNHLSTNPADIPKDYRQQQFLSTMRHHREQLVIYIDSLKQALNSLDRLASLEPTCSEIHLANMKIDTIQQKSRQLRALKSNRSSQQSPFIECRIRQLEHDLVYMLSEHQKDVQAKLELNEQRSRMLLKIMQVTDELAAVDQQIQQLLSNKTLNTNIHQTNPSNEINQQQSLRFINSTNNLDGRRVSFREPTDNNPLTKLTNIICNKMRKSATTILPRSTSTHLTPTQRKNSSTTTTTTQLPHSTSHHNCQKFISNNTNTNNNRSRSICSRTNFFTSPTTHELSRFEPIFNHDTDSLKIGDRIYVNGQWSGIILYIGETTLGIGDWAGVILDDPSLGKTNGIVRGRCYFQTTNNRGIFCRLTKLTREKILSCEIEEKK
ncbi:unnamed protein product [Rotaria sordida]|uniref:CAP-Gly domain-containing protein n=1 Tax=Rotaria sordida TaxID=392033 RepID=A0A814SES2_9BILA|nr:unnamed protein product [Rotaria sordida]